MRTCRPGICGCYFFHGEGNQGFINPNPNSKPNLNSERQLQPELTLALTLNLTIILNLNLNPDLIPNPRPMCIVWSGGEVGVVEEWSDARNLSTMALYATLCAGATLYGLLSGELRRTCLMGVSVVVLFFSPAMQVRS